MSCPRRTHDRVSVESLGLIAGVSLCVTLCSKGLSERLDLRAYEWLYS